MGGGVVWSLDSREVSWPGVAGQTLGDPMASRQGSRQSATSDRGVQWKSGCQRVWGRGQQSAQSAQGGGEEGGACRRDHSSVCDSLSCRQSVGCTGFGFHVERAAERLAPGQSCKVTQGPRGLWLGRLSGVPHTHAADLSPSATAEVSSFCNVPPVPSTEKAYHRARGKEERLQNFTGSHRAYILKGAFRAERQQIDNWHNVLLLYSRLGLSLND